MDTITTGIGGALLAKALPEDYRGPSGVLVVTAASVLPDIDVFASFFNDDPMGRLATHRAFTHALAGVVVLAPLLALLFRRFSKDKNFRRLLALSVLGLLWHMFTDLATSWGTMIYHPFSYERVVWDIIFIIDFVFTGILLLPQLIAWTYRNRARSWRRGLPLWAALTVFTALMVRVGSQFFGVSYRWDLLALLTAILAALFLAPALRGWGFRQSRATFARVGVAALVAYVALCTGAHFAALQEVKQMAGERGLRVERIGALPQPLSPFRWQGLVLTPEGVHQSQFSVLDSGAPRFDFYPSDRNEYVERARQLREVQTYLWFARFPVARYRQAGGRHIVEFADLRFASGRTRNPQFGFRVAFNERGEVLSNGFNSSD